MAASTSKKTYATTYIFKEKIFPKAKTNLAKSANQLIAYINKYMDRNSEIIFAKGLYKQLVYVGEDLNILYKSIGFTDKEIALAIKETGQTKSSWVIFNRPDYWTLMMILKYFKDSKKEKEFKIVLMYFTLALYSSVFYDFTRGYGFNEAIMDYTINNLSNKYDIKKLGSLFKALYKLADTCNETYIKYFDSFDDRLILEYIMNLRTRVKNFVKEIKSAYEKNKASGKYLNYDQEDKSEENYYEVDNASFLIDRLSSKVTNYCISNGVDMKISNLAAQLCEVSKVAIADALDKVIKTENKEIKELVSILLQQYLVDESKPAEGIGSKNFITVALKIYAKSNTTDKNVIRLKDILDKWLNATCERYKKTERAATKNNLRKAIFMYFVLCTQKIYIG